MCPLFWWYIFIVFFMVDFSQNIFVISHIFSVDFVVDDAVIDCGIYV